ncbi:GPI transamidase component GAB1 [[Candida] zeylanoides]
MSPLSYALALGFAIRFLAPTVVPSLTANVASVEVTTPLTSFRALQEAFYYLRHGINLYDGGVNHHPPLLVVVLSWVNAMPWAVIAFNALYAACDVWVAYRLVALNTWYATTLAQPPMETSPGTATTKPTAPTPRLAPRAHLIAAFVLFNPLLILTNWSHSTLVFTHFFLIEAVYQTCLASPSRGMIVLALASYIGYTPIYLVVPLASLAVTVSPTSVSAAGIVFGAVGVFIASCSLLVLASFAMTSSWQFVDACWATVIRSDKLSPNLGLWWYFFTEMFAFFNPFFVGIFNLYSVLFVLPITLRFSQPRETSRQLGDAFLAVILCHLWLIFSKPYPAVGDLGLVLSIIPIFRSTFLGHCKFAAITAQFMLGSLVLSPIFYYCWIVLGNGNSNFFYSINLVWGGVHGAILMDLIWGKLTYDYIRENNIAVVDQPKLRLTQI